MVAKKAPTAPTVIQVAPLQMGTIKLRIIGTQPLFQNRMSAKAKQQLLVGGGKKTAAEKLKVKHDPVSEFRDALEIMKAGPTAIGQRIVSLKAAMCTAALETEGLKKTSAQRALFMPGELAALYGTPQLRMDVVRSADINRTPDIRTRPFFERWGCEIDVNYLHPALNQHAVVTLLANAGMLIGVGDYRQEKGKGSFGLFRVIAPSQQDDEWDDLVENHARVAQLAAIEDPTPSNEETEELFEFCLGEMKRRAA